jgi:hypothetical protein
MKVIADKHLGLSVVSLKEALPTFLLMIIPAPRAEL